jgi:hypothetical protein
LLEQHHTREQAQLLEKFQQLRAWQLTQQQRLMKQQQEQMERLKHEQDKVELMIGRQRQQQWGSGSSTKVKGQGQMSDNALMYLPHRTNH